jgi:hypothetical protein
LENQWEERRVNEFPVQAGVGKRVYAGTLATKDGLVANGGARGVNPPALRLLAS